jgi:peptidoglycan L-alanyl-D-glutamate endopeptidase CwlK
LIEAAVSFLLNLSARLWIDTRGLSVHHRHPEAKGSEGELPFKITPFAQMNIEGIIRAIQKEVGVTADGKAGPKTWEAIYNRIVPKMPPATAPPIPDEKVDSRSEKVIATLLPEVKPYARALVVKAAAAGITIKAISGLRTYAEQNALYEQGRSKPGRKVTNARGGYSNHNFGIAFDIGVFEGSKYIPESPKYKAVGAIGIDLGLEWGGNWKSIKDEPHFQLPPKWAADMTESKMLAELRARKESGKPFYA